MLTLFPDLRFCVIGDGEHLPQLQSKYSFPGLVFCGDMSTKSIAELYAQSHVSVFASTIDAFGMSIAESIST